MVLVSNLYRLSNAPGKCLRLLADSSSSCIVNVVNDWVLLAATFVYGEYCLPYRLLQYASGAVKEVQKIPLVSGQLGVTPSLNHNMYPLNK